MSSYTIPSVVEKTIRGERAVDIYSRLLTDRIIYVGTEIDDGVANVVIAQLLHLESESQASPIDLYLNSPGGSVTAMLAVYDTMQYIGAPVATTCVGQAASSAAVLLAGGAEGRRMVLRTRGSSCTSPRAGVRGHCPTSPYRPRRSCGCAPRRSRSCPGTRARPWNGFARTPVATWCTAHEGSPTASRTGCWRNARPTVRRDRSVGSSACG